MPGPERSDDGRVAAIPGAVPQEGQTTHPEAGDWISPTVDLRASQVSENGYETIWLLFEGGKWMPTTTPLMQL